MKWPNEQAKSVYQLFVTQFDQLQIVDVIWEPYSHERVNERAPLGLSSMCTRDHAYWLTKSHLVYDIFIEPYCVYRVMRQLGLRQQFPLPLAFDRHDKGCHG